MWNATNPNQPQESNSGDEDFTCMSIRKPANDELDLPLQKDLFTPTLYWPMVESSLGIVGACLPLFRPIVKDIYPVRSIREIISFPSLSLTSSEKALKDVRILENGDNGSSASSPKGSIYAGENYQR